MHREWGRSVSRYAEQSLSVKPLPDERQFDRASTVQL